MIDDRKKKSN